MSTSRIKYKGQLRTEFEHLKSGVKVISDAPTDNHGKGEAFSPTDMVATSLGTCMITIMGIVADKNQIPFENCTAEVTKVMGSNPRRISEIHINLSLAGNELNDSQKEQLEIAAKNCPVAKSLSSDIEQVLSFSY